MCGEAATGVQAIRQEVATAKASIAVVFNRMPIGSFSLPGSSEIVCNGGLRHGAFVQTLWAICSTDLAETAFLEARYPRGWYFVGQAPDHGPEPLYELVGLGTSGNLYRTVGRRFRRRSGCRGTAAMPWAERQGCSWRVLTSMMMA